MSLVDFIPCHVNSKSYINLLDYIDTLFANFLEANKLSTVMALDLFGGEKATFVSAMWLMCYWSYTHTYRWLGWSSAWQWKTRFLLYLNQCSVQFGLKIPEIVCNPVKLTKWVNLRKISIKHTYIYHYAIENDVGFSSPTLLKLYLWKKLIRCMPWIRFP